MYKVELYARVHRACMVDGMSTRAASRVLGLHRDTVHKMLEYPVPLGYRRRSPPRRPKLDPYRGVIDRILEEDRSLPKKQRHTAKRIYERLRAEHGFGGKYTIVKDYVRERRRRTREMYVPLSHPPGDAQRDFGQAKAVIGGVEQTVHYFVLDLPHSDACVVKAYPAETTEAFCDGHVSAFSFLGGVSRSIVYNTRLAVARILGDGRRRRTRVFSELQSHYLFDDRFGRPGKDISYPMDTKSSGIRGRWDLDPVDYEYGVTWNGHGRTRKATASRRRKPTSDRGHGGKAVQQGQVKGIDHRRPTPTTVASSSLLGWADVYGRQNRGVKGHIFAGPPG